MTQRKPAMLALSDGLVLTGWSCGADGEHSGEICFNTSMSGYQEVVTDPSYAGQIITMTMPQIGNYGINREDMESRGVFASGLVVREMCHEPSSWRSEESLPGFLARSGVVAIEGVDTRMLVRHIREVGAMSAVISTVDLDPGSLVEKAKAAPGLYGMDMVSRVTFGRTYEFGPDMPVDLNCSAYGVVGREPSSIPLVADDRPLFRVVAVDSGIKYNIIRSLVDRNCLVTVVPATATAAEILSHNPEGIFFANGPGDPDQVPYLYETLRSLIGVKPIFGICLGHQMLSLAVGASTYKLKYGHRGGNHPVRNLLSGRVEITAQNHGYCVDFGSIGTLNVAESEGVDLNLDDLRPWVERGAAPVLDSPNFGRVQLTHVNLNDMTVEGIRLLDHEAYSVQYHPEAAPGPHDARYLFDEFIQLMEYRRSSTEGSVS